MILHDEKEEKTLRWFLVVWLGSILWKVICKSTGFGGWVWE